MTRIRRRLGAIVSTLAVIGAGLTIATTALVVTSVPAGAVNASDDLSFRTAFANILTTQIDLTGNIAMNCSSGTWLRVGGVSPTNDVVIDGHGFALDATGCVTQAMFNSGSNKITFRDVYLTGGRYELSGSHVGGFLQSNSGDVTLINVSMEQNEVRIITPGSSAFAASGGGMWVGGTATLINSSVVNNTVRCNVTCGLAYGGGVLATNIVAINSTISDNIATDNNLGTTPDTGGGLVVNGGTLDLTYTTIADNQASTGSNIYRTGSGAVSSFASVVANMQSGSSGNCSGFSTITSNGYNYEETSSSTCGFGSGTGDLVQGNDVNLALLSSNGSNGLAATKMPNPGSPLIDQIPAANCDDDGAASIVPLVDQRGKPRPRNVKCDIGAVEVPLGSFTPVTPIRVLDTRNGTGLSGAFSPQQTRSLQVGGFGPVPNNASAVLLNVTATGSSKAGWLTLFPADGSLPTASNLNFGAGQTIANLVVVKLGLPGAGSGIEYNIKINNTGGNAQAGTVHVVADVMGYYSDPTLPINDGFTGLTPARILDTRTGTGLSGTFAPQQVRSLTVGGVEGVPTDADAVVMNVTATAPTKAGWLTIFPADVGTPPTASNLNFLAGETVPNLVTVKLGVGGADEDKVKIANSFGNAQAGTVHVIADVVGYYKFQTGGSLISIAPQRILDTRNGTGGVTGPVAGLATITVTPQTAPAVPAAGAYTAVVVNVTATGGTKAGWLTVFPSDGSLPTASNLNFVAGQTVPNLVKINVGPDGKFKINNSGGNPNPGTVQIVVDIVGYYTTDVF